MKAGKEKKGFYKVIDGEKIFFADPEPVKYGKKKKKRSARKFFKSLKYYR